MQNKVPEKKIVRHFVPYKKWSKKSPKKCPEK